MISEQQLQESHHFCSYPTCLQSNHFSVVAPGGRMRVNIVMCYFAPQHAEVRLFNNSPQIAQTPHLPEGTGPDKEDVLRFHVIHNDGLGTQEQC